MARVCTSTGPSVSGGSGTSTTAAEVAWPGITVKARMADLRAICVSTMCKRCARFPEGGPAQRLLPLQSESEQEERKFMKRISLLAVLTFALPALPLQAADSPALLEIEA